MAKDSISTGMMVVYTLIECLANVDHWTMLGHPPSTHPSSSIPDIRGSPSSNSEQYPLQDQQEEVHILYYDYTILADVPIDIYANTTLGCSLFFLDQILDNLLEDQNHLIFLCACKEPVWETMLSKYTTKDIWTVASLLSLLSIKPVPYTMKAPCPLSKSQLTTAIVLAVWDHHWACQFDNTPFSSAAAITLAERTVTMIAL
ncbi:hypothetical protein BGZ93_004034, partial [Podila epicladia]